MNQTIPPKTNLGGGVKYFLFSPLFGEDSHFDEHIFQMGWNHQPVTYPLSKKLASQKRKRIVFQDINLQGAQTRC